MSARPLISNHIEISGSCQTEDDVLCFSGSLTLHSFVDGNLDCVAAPRFWLWGNPGRKALIQQNSYRGNEVRLHGLQKGWIHCRACTSLREDIPFLCRRSHMHIYHVSDLDRRLVLLRWCRSLLRRGASHRQMEKSDRRGWNRHRHSRWWYLVLHRISEGLPVLRDRWQTGAGFFFMSARTLYHWVGISFPSR